MPLPSHVDRRCNGAHHHGATEPVVVDITAAPALGEHVQVRDLADYEVAQ